MTINFFLFIVSTWALQKVAAFITTTSIPFIECPIRYGFVVNPDATSKCDRYFYNCNNFIGYRQICPSDLHFDPDKEVCNIRQNIRVCNESKSNFEFDCYVRFDGNYADVMSVPPKCSSRYFTCKQGTVHVNHCPPGFYFDVVHNWCDKFWNVADCTADTNTASDFDCSDKDDGIYTDPSQHCSRIYFVCVNRLSYKLECQYSMYYDPESLTCQPFGNVLACTGHRPPKRPVQTDSDVFFNCTNLPNGLYADPNKSCTSHYFNCFNEISYMMPCPSQLYYDSMKKECNYKSEIPGCAAFLPSANYTANALNFFKNQQKNITANETSP